MEFVRPTKTQTGRTTLFTNHASTDAYTCTIIFQSSEWTTLAAELL